MKKWFSLFWAAGLLFSLVACTDSESGSQVAGSFTPSTVSDSTDSSSSLTAGGPSTETSANNSSEEQTGSDILISYFSWADNAVLDGEVDAVASPSVTAPGNVQELAGWIQQETGGDLFSIRVTDPYSSDWDECLARANQERAENARPALEEKVEDLEQYDTVFLGYPNWWNDAPMAVYSFLEAYDFSGKILIPFNTSSSGGFGRSLAGISASADGATVLDGLSLTEEDLSERQELVSAWLTDLEIAG